MKELTTEEFSEAPNRVQYIHMCAHQNIPIGMSILDEAIDKYPEYFPDEVEHIRKWAAVPEELKDEYFKKCAEIHREVFADAPQCPNKGLLHMIRDPEGQKEMKAWEESNKIRFPKKEKLKDQLYDKMFGKYGLKAKINN